MMSLTPVERLQKAGLCDQRDLSEREREALNSLSDQEVEQLIHLTKKLGSPETDAARPIFPI
jgi:hypothetical protein